MVSPFQMPMMPGQNPQWGSDVMNQPAGMHPGAMTPKPWQMPMAQPWRQPLQQGGRPFGAMLMPPSSGGGLPGMINPATLPGMMGQQQQAAQPTAPPPQQPQGALAPPPPDARSYTAATYPANTAAPPSLVPAGYAPLPAGAPPYQHAGVAVGQTPDVPLPGIPDYIWQLAMNPPGA